MIHCNHCSEIDENAQKQIKAWAIRLRKELQNSPSYIYRDTIQVMEEMEKEVETTDY